MFSSLISDKKRNRTIILLPKLSGSPLSEMFEWTRFKVVMIDWVPEKVKPIGFADLTTSSALDIAAHS